MGQHVDNSSMLNMEVVFKAIFSIMALTSTEGVTVTSGKWKGVSRV